MAHGDYTVSALTSWITILWDTLISLVGSHTLVVTLTDSSSSTVSTNSGSTYTVVPHYLLTASALCKHYYTAAANNHTGYNRHCTLLYYSLPVEALHHGNGDDSTSTLLSYQSNSLQ